MDASTVREERAELLRLRRESGLTYADLAELTGIAPATWRWWERRLGRGPKPAPAKRAPGARFTEVRLERAGAAGPWAFEIEVGERVVRVAPGFEGASLARLLETLA